MASKNAERPTVGRQLLDVKKCEPISSKNPFRGEEREVRKMLVVDGVELVALHQPQKVGKLQGEDALRLQCNFHSGHEVAQVRHLGEYIVANQQVRASLFPGQIGRHLFSEEPNKRRYPLLHSDFGDICGRFDPQNGNVLLDEILKKVTVIAGDFRDQALFADGESLNHLVCILAAVLQPAFGVRGKISVLGENVIWGYVFLQLHQETFVADEYMERIKRLHFVELIQSKITLAERRHSEIDEGLVQRVAAESAIARTICGLVHKRRRIIRLYLALRALMCSSTFCAAFSPLMKASSVQM